MPAFHAKVGTGPAVSESESPTSAYVAGLPCYSLDLGV